MSTAPAAAAADQAADWHTRLKTRSVSNRELDDFYAWRKDPANAAAYAEVEGVWAKAAPLIHDPDIQAATAGTIADVKDWTISDSTFTTTDGTQPVIPEGGGQIIKPGQSQ